MKGLPRSLARDKTSSAMKKAVINVKDLQLNVAGTTGVGFGNVVLGKLPKGVLIIYGVASGVKLKTNDPDVLPNFTGNYAIGTSGTADATLSGAEVNLIPSTAIPAATGGVSNEVRAVSTVAQIIDNTGGTPLNAVLNVTIADASISGPGTFSVDGWVEINYSVMGEDRPIEGST